MFKLKLNVMILQGYFFFYFLQGYFIVSWWLKFKGLSWILTACITLVLLCFFFVNFWAVKYFDWR